MAQQGSTLQVLVLGLVVAAVAAPTLLPRPARTLAPPPELAVVLRAGGAEAVAARATLVLSARQRLALGLPIALNAASKEVLELLPGVGRTLARRLAAARLSRGGWRRLIEVAAVRGISARQLQRWRGMVTLAASADPPASRRDLVP
ncbi:MAG: helix-hairpin-helix domain-containing protein [Proteobacteria bacterium]|nr:helix-hairpin-helix domain-containing protein [Pseudomonadota bacterium]